MLTFLAKMKQTIAIIGSGPAALLLAAHIDNEQYTVHIYEQNKALARKFLVAGDGGFNLSHSEAMELLAQRYTPNNFLQASLQSFTNIHFCHWLQSIGIETYIGSSKRIFPIKTIKPIMVLQAIIKELERKKVVIHTHHQWLGWNPDNHLLFGTKKEEITIKADKVVFALGGGSWAKTGSNAAWMKHFETRGIICKPFEASNCAYGIDWKTDFIASQEGKTLKNISISIGNEVKNGELVITKFGLEGGAVYALSPQIRAMIHQSGTVSACIDLKPSYTETQLIDKLSNRGKKTISEVLKNDIKLQETALALLKTYLDKASYNSVHTLAKTIKHFSLIINKIAPVDEAISTVGGIALEELKPHFELHKLPQHYAIGEMLDWDAPTGGYLIQACASMGYYLAQHFNAKP